MARGSDSAASPVQQELPPRATGGRALKDRVRLFWERRPCGASDAAQIEEGSLAFFEQVERMRYEGDEFMWDVVGFDRWRGKTVLEAGCGLGTDLLQFARHGARVTGVDLTERGASLTRRRLALYGVPGVVSVADGENLPFRSASFDLVYSWGVVHHTPRPPAMASELVRVTRPGGTVIAMVYHRCSRSRSGSSMDSFAARRGARRRGLSRSISRVRARRSTASTRHGSSSES